MPSRIDYVPNGYPYTPAAVIPARKTSANVLIPATMHESTNGNNGHASSSKDGSALLNKFLQSHEELISYRWDSFSP